ncbi:MAG TPA: hypothetical protein VFB81_11660 [Myxococcales bacterium]|nr:hypothetical protein [Myxococcales bacterium]
MNRVTTMILVGALGLGCAAIAPVPPPAPGTKQHDLKKNEIVVIGKGPIPMPGMKPQDEGTEFVVVGRETLRCTRVAKSVRNPKGIANCRNLTRNESRNPDPGRVARYPTQGGWR